MMLLTPRVALSVGVVVACMVCFFIGKKRGVADERLETNRKELVANDSGTKRDSIRADSADKQDSILTVYRTRVREKVIVRHDTILLPPTINHSKDSIIAVSPEIAQLIAADDSTIRALERSLALRDTLIASLRQGSALRDQRIKLLESAGTHRFSKGIQIGAGYCATAVGQMPCLYLGYGFSVRLP